MRAFNAQVDHIRDATPARKELNTKLLLAKNLNRLLRIVDENVRSPPLHAL